MPFKLNQDRRHHIPKQKHRVTNWPAYDAALRQRGSLTVWFSDEAIAAWRAEPRTTRAKRSTLLLYRAEGVPEHGCGLSGVPQLVGLGGAG